MLRGYSTHRQQKKLKNKTINVELAAIRTALNWALDNEWIDKNPAYKIKMLKADNSKKGRVITEEEVKALLDGCSLIKEGEWFRNILCSE